MYDRPLEGKRLLLTEGQKETKKLHDESKK